MRKAYEDAVREYGAKEPGKEYRQCKVSVWKITWASLSMAETLRMANAGAIYM